MKHISEKMLNVFLNTLIEKSLSSAIIESLKYCSIIDGIVYDNEKVIQVFKNNFHVDGDDIKHIIEVSLNDCVDYIINEKDVIKPEELYNLDYAFRKWLQPRLIQFHNKVVGYPICYDNVDEWKKEIKNGIDLLTASLSDEYEISDDAIPKFNKWWFEYNGMLWQ